MRATHQIVWAAIGLVLLAFAGIVSVYQVLFSLWMTAYPMADINFRGPHFYFRLAQTATIGLLWGGLAVWMIREKRDR